MLWLPIVTQCSVVSYNVPLQKRTKVKRGYVTCSRQWDQHSNPVLTPSSSEIFSPLPLPLQHQCYTKVSPADTMLLMCQCQGKAGPLAPDQPHLGPMTLLKSPSSPRGVKKISSWAAKADAVDCSLLWMPSGNEAQKTGEQCSWQQTRVQMKSKLPTRTSPSV